MKERFGLVLIALALSTLGTNMLIPLGLMAAGLWLIRGVIEW